MDDITAKLGHLFHGGRHFIRARQAAADRGIEHGRAHWSDRMGARAGRSLVTSVALIELVIARDRARARRICRPIALAKFWFHVTPAVIPGPIWRKMPFFERPLSH